VCGKYWFPCVWRIVDFQAKSTIRHTQVMSGLKPNRRNLIDATKKIGAAPFKSLRAKPR